jgi:hypothetical protein
MPSDLPVIDLSPVEIGATAFASDAACQQAREIFIERLVASNKKAVSRCDAVAIAR